MNPPEKLDPRLLEMLSAYLDGTLEGAEKAVVEARLNTEENLRRELAELRSVRDSLRALPLRKPPRSLALSPAMAGKQAERPASRSTGWMALGSALATLALLCVLGLNAISSGAFIPGAGAPRAFAANEAMTAPQTAEDHTGAGKSGAAQPTAGPVRNQTAAATGCDNCEPTATPAEVPSPAPLLGGGCGACSATEEQTVHRPQAASLPTAMAVQLRATPNFQTVAPYLEVFLALAAVLLAVAAALTGWSHRRARRRGERKP